jgi:hypothetical protein
MMSSTAWVRLVLLRASLHLVNSVVPCCCIVEHRSGA